MCGVLQCKGGQHPPGRTSCILNRVCHALTTEDGTAYELVPEGTRCGPEKVSPWLRGRATPQASRACAPPADAFLAWQLLEAVGTESCPHF